MILYNREHQLLLYNPTVKRKLKFSLLRGSLRSWVHIFIKGEFRCSLLLHFVKGFYSTSH